MKSNNNWIRFSTLVFVIAIVLTSCQKKHAFTYKVECSECIISYFDTDGRFVSQEALQGTKQIDIEVPQFTAVQIAAQSTICPATNPCDSSFVPEIPLKVELLKGNEVLCTQTKPGLNGEAVTCTYIWPK